mmetsp:Transcript_92953/g.259768  ORF Transcript_92953/g.259768 Transcript_92953/m.259768 type:complete len:133 (-) Transcript_92953:44-442(-)
MVFYETTFLIHSRFAAPECKLLLKETSRAITEKDGAIFRILDLGWRHTAQPVQKPGLGKFHYGRWYVLTWGGPPLAVRDIHEQFKLNTGVLRYITEKIRHPGDMYKNRATFYPTLDAGKGLTPPLTHHAPIR